MEKLADGSQKIGRDRAEKVENTRLENDGLPVPLRYWAAIALWLALAMSVLDSSIANIALPTIAQELGATAAKSIWVVNAYQIAIAMILLPVASLAERAGYRRIYGLGLIIFVTASLGCVLARDLTGLAIARFIQGFGAASVMATNPALLRFIYPKAMLGRGVGYNTLVVAISAAAGPSVAAGILAIGSWRWLFAVNIPLGLLALVIGLRCLPLVRSGTSRFDTMSALVNVAAFAAVFLVVSDIAHDEVSIRTAVEAVIAIIASVTLIRRVRLRASPLVPLDLLRIPLLRLSYAASFCSYAAQMVALISLPFLLQIRFGFNRVETGLLITPIPLGVAVAAPIAGRLVERASAGLLGAIGLALFAIGIALLALLPTGRDLPSIVLPMLLAGIGFGLFQTPNNRTMLIFAPYRRSGAAAGMLATSRLVGQTTGAVLVALIFRVIGASSEAPLLLASALSATAIVPSLLRLREFGARSGATDENRQPRPR